MKQDIFERRKGMSITFEQFDYINLESTIYVYKGTEYDFDFRSDPEIRKVNRRTLQKLSESHNLLVEACWITVTSDGEQKLKVILVDREEVQ